MELIGGQPVRPDQVRPDIVAVRKGSVFDVSGRGKILGGIAANPLRANEFLYIERLHREIEWDGAVEIFGSPAAIRAWKFKTDRKELIDAIIKELEGSAKLKNDIGVVRKPRLPKR